MTSLYLGNIHLFNRINYASLCHLVSKYSIIYFNPTKKLIQELSFFFSYRPPSSPEVPISALNFYWKKHTLLRLFSWLVFFSFPAIFFFSPGTCYFTIEWYKSWIVSLKIFILLLAPGTSLVIFIADMQRSEYKIFFFKEFYVRA